MFAIAFNTGWTCAGMALAAFGFATIRSGFRFRQMRRRRRALRLELMREAKICPKCGYDVRGSGDRCSECGWPTAGPK